MAGQVGHNDAAQISLPRLIVKAWAEAGAKNIEMTFDREALLIRPVVQQ